MPKLLQKIIFSFLVFLITFISVAPNFMVAKAQTSWYSQNPAEWYLKVYDPSISPPNEIFGERYTAAQVQWVVWSFLFLPIRALIAPIHGGEDALLFAMKLFGTGTLDPANALDALKGAIETVFDEVDDLIDHNGPIGANNMPFLAQVFDTSNRDMSGIAYTRDLLKKFSLVSEVKAQGVGYPGLTWVQKYWTGFRDISYGLLVLVIIVFAFMIMFRVKLSPQTVISVQSALPKVILTLILVTFSYAIAGFAIDLMYVMSGLFALLLKIAGFSTDISGPFGFISGTGFFQNTFGGFWVLIFMLLYTILFFLGAVIVFFGSFLGFLNIFGMLLGVVFVLMSVYVLVLCIIYTFKIPYVLIKTLISLYILIITAPVQILAGAIVPSMGFGSWFKKLMADIMVFPVVGLLFWFALATLMSAYAQAGLDVGRFWANLFGSTAYPNAWVPEIIGSRGLFVANSGITGVLMLGISFGMIALIPKVPDMLKGMLLGEKFSFGTALGESIGEPAKGIAIGAEATKKYGSNIVTGWQYVKNKLNRAPEAPETPSLDEYPHTDSGY